MDELEATVPTLADVVAQISKLAESGGSYEEAPHIIEVTLPLICRLFHNSHLDYNISQLTNLLTIIIPSDHLLLILINHLIITL